jgi:uncharacterized protein with HEPN domain
VERFTWGLTYEQCLEDEKTVDGVTRNIEIIGEAVKSLSKEVKDASPELEWDAIVGMRNKLIHQYWGTDMDIVWKAAKEDLPKLKTVVEKLIDSIL